MKKESSTNLQKYSGIAELDRIGNIIGTGYTPNIDPDKEEHNLPETEKYFQRWTKSNN